MRNYLLVINAGSSSIKFAIYQKPASSAQLVADASGQIDGIGAQATFVVKSSERQLLADSVLSADLAENHAKALALLLDWIWGYLADGVLLAVGHRVVHGGAHFAAPVLMNAHTLTILEKFVPLAPLHQPHNLAPIRHLMALLPDLPQVACFDTAFHRTQPDVAQRFALPRRFADEGVCRYGFHGLSYEYIASVLPSLEPALARARVIVAHLGNGASLCALREGRSIATTMGFSPLDGLIMGTRCGAIDPGVLLYLMDRHDMTARDLERLLYHQSGLLGVSGISNDMRTLLASGDAHAREAIELFVYRIGREIGSLIVALGGLDALVFTGGIGEHSPEIRAQIGQQLAWQGLELDPAANKAAALRISSIDSKLSAWVVATDENLMIARHTLRRIAEA